MIMSGRCLHLMGLLPKSRTFESGKKKLSKLTLVVTRRSEGKRASPVVEWRHQMERRIISEKDICTPHRLVNIQGAMVVPM